MGCTESDNSKQIKCARARAIASIPPSKVNQFQIEQIQRIPSSQSSQFLKNIIISHEKFQKYYDTELNSEMMKNLVGGNCPSQLSLFSSVGMKDSAYDAWMSSQRIRDLCLNDMPFFSREGKELWKDSQIFLV